jgi:hypothetical protein
MYIPAVFFKYIFNFPVCRRNHVLATSGPAEISHFLQGYLQLYAFKKEQKLDFVTSRLFDDETEKILLPAKKLTSLLVFVF